MRVPIHRFNRGRVNILDDRGASAIEFAVLAPLLMLMLIGALQLSMVISNYSMVENAVHVGSRYLAISRGDPTPVTDTQTAMYGAMGTLQKASFSVTYTINGSPCASDAACSAALSPGTQSTVAASYPCSIIIMGVNFAPNCRLTAATTGRVE